MSQTKEKIILPVLLLVGMGLIIGGITAFFYSATPKAVAAPTSGVTQLVFAPSAELPYLLTRNGDFLMPTDGGEWQRVRLDDTTIHSLYIDEQNTIWAATNRGLHNHSDNAWHLVDPTPMQSIIAVETELIKIGMDGKIHGTVDGDTLPTPPDDGLVDAILPLGNDTTLHAAHAADGVYISIDLSNEWQRLDSPNPIYAIWEDGHGNMLAGMADGVFQWEQSANTWVKRLPAAGSAPFDDMRTFGNDVFATSNGQLLRYAADRWEQVALGGGEIYITQLEQDRNGRLWALDSAHERLWSTVDGINWTETAIRIAEVAS